MLCVFVLPLGQDFFCWKGTFMREFDKTKKILPKNFSGDEVFA